MLVHIHVNILIHIHVNMLLHIHVNMFVNKCVNGHVDKCVNKSVSMLKNMCWFKSKSRWHSIASWVIFKLRQGASMDGFCWMVGWLVGWLLEKSVEHFLQCDWSTRAMQVILLVSHWSESVLVYVHSLVDSTSVQRLVQRLE
jgi:hypothetical protein